MRRCILFGLSMLLFAASSVHAQATSGASDAIRGLRIGSKIRIITTHHDIVQGTLLRVTSDSLYLTSHSASGFAINQLRTIQISAGRKNRAGRYALIGTLVGFGLGALIGASGFDPPCAQSSSCEISRTDVAIVGGVALAVPGMVIGVLSGRNVEQWVAVQQ